MVSINKIKEHIKLFSNEDKTLAEFLASLFDDKFVEVYMGDTFETISTEQVNKPIPAVFCGKVVGAYKDCLVLNSIYKDKTKKQQSVHENTIKLGNLVFINTTFIYALNDLTSNGSLSDLVLSSKEDVNIIKKHLVNSGQNV